MDEQFDWVISRLQQADPQRVASVPSAESPAARAMFQEILMTGPEAHVPHNAYTTPVEPLRARRSRWILVGGGAAVAAASTVALVISRPGERADAAAEVAKAASASTTAATDHVRATTTFSASGLADQLGTDTLAGTFTATAVGDDLDVALQLDAASAAAVESKVGALPFGLDAPSLDDLEVRVIDGVTYERHGDAGWTKYDVTQALGELGGADGLDLGLPTFDPRDAFTELQDLTDAVRIGEETIDGQTVTHYRGTTELGGGASAVDGWFDDAGMFSSPMTAQVDLYVGTDDLLRRVEATAAPDDAATPTITLVSELSYDADLSIEVPADATEGAIPSLGDLPSLDELPTLDSLPDGVGADLDVLVKLATEHPGLCNAELMAVPTSGDTADLVTCLRDAGENDAADAVERLGETYGGLIGG